MNKIRYTGIILSTISIIYLCVFSCTVITSTKGLWVNLVFFIILIIPSVINIYFLRWVQPIDRLKLTKFSKINENEILDLPVASKSENLEVVRVLKNFVPLKFWTVIAIILHFFVARHIVINIIKPLLRGFFRFDVHLINVLVFVFCLISVCLINSLILLRIQLMK